MKKFEAYFVNILTGLHVMNVWFVWHKIPTYSFTKFSKEYDKHRPHDLRLEKHKISTAIVVMMRFVWYVRSTIKNDIWKSSIILYAIVKNADDPRYKNI